MQFLKYMMTLMKKTAIQNMIIMEYICQREQH